MKITIKLFATLQKYAGSGSKGTVELDFPDAVSIAEVLDQLTIPADIPKIILVNGIQKTMHDILSDGDSVSIFPPIAGG